MNTDFSALASMFNPKSVAIVGATDDPRAIGGRPIVTMQQAGLPGNDSADQSEAKRRVRDPMLCLRRRSSASAGCRLGGRARFVGARHRRPTWPAWLQGRHTILSRIFRTRCRRRGLAEAYSRYRPRLQHAPCLAPTASAGSMLRPAITARSPPPSTTACRSPAILASPPSRVRSAPISLRWRAIAAWAIRSSSPPATRPTCRSVMPLAGWPVTTRSTSSAPISKGSTSRRCS